MAAITFAEEEQQRADLPGEFEPYVKAWFNEQFEALSPPQEYAFDLIHAGEHTLISAPTGSGKTLSAFLASLNELFLMGDEGELEDQIYVVYVSPLRALNNDIHRNLEEPLQGIREQAEELGIDMPEVRSAVRTGDTPQSERSKMLENPPHILITTPETLAILLDAPKFKEHFTSVKYIIADEIHSLCDNKRGVHFSISLERLTRMSNHDPTRIGLSATQSPIEEIAKFLVGYEKGESRGCTIVDVTAPKELDLEVVTPVHDLIHTDTGTIHDKMYETLHAMIDEHETTLIFTNTRAATERVVNTLKNRFPRHYDNENIGAHHSSMGREKRLQIEENLKEGELDVAVCSTSLELGIDIGSIDLVIQIGSPKGIARGIQRIGRSGHKLHENPKGRFVVTDRDDAMECAVLAERAHANVLDRVRIPTNCLDVLAQHLVGMACNRKWDIEEALELVKRAYNYRDLEKRYFLETLRYLAGEYVSLEEQHVYGKIWLDGEDGMFGRRGKMTRMIYMTNIGTIPDEANFRVFTRGDKTFVGTLDEEFLDKLVKGDIFVLGGETYEFQYARGMKVYVDRVPEKKPTVPAWFSEMLPLSFDLGVAIGTFRKKVQEQLDMGFGRTEVVEWIKNEYPVDENTANTLFSYLHEMYQYVGVIPTHENILVERTIDDRGRVNLVFHTIYGRETNDALSRIFAHIVSKQAGSNLGITVDDSGFVLSLGRRGMDIDRVFEIFQESDVRDVLKQTVRRTEVMKRRFRHVAGRALMILRNYKGNKKSVGKQQMNAHFLLHACEKIDPDFPILHETYREIMEDAMDVIHAQEFQERLKEKEWNFTYAERDVPSPFAQPLIVQGQSDAVLLEDKKERLQKLHEEVMARIPAG